MEIFCCVSILGVNDLPEAMMIAYRKEVFQHFLVCS